MTEREPVAPRTAGLRARLRETLADGEWHAFNDLYAAAADLISEEYALDRYSRLRKGGRTREEEIEIGRRDAVRQSLFLILTERRDDPEYPRDSDKQLFRLAPPPKE